MADAMHCEDASPRILHWHGCRAGGAVCRKALSVRSVSPSRAALPNARASAFLNSDGTNNARSWCLRSCVNSGQIGLSWSSAWTLDQ